MTSLQRKYDEDKRNEGLFGNNLEKQKMKNREL